MKSSTRSDTTHRMARICMVLHDRELADYRVINEAKTLVEQGHSVTILMPTIAATPEIRNFEGLQVIATPLANPSNRTFLKLTFTSSWKTGLQILNTEYSIQIATSAETESHKAVSVSKPPAEIAPTRQANGTRDCTSRRFSQLLRFPTRLFNVSIRHLIKFILKAFRLQGRIEQIVWLRMEAAFTHFLREIQPDIIHAHDLPSLRLSRYLAAEMGCNLVYDAHEFYSAQGGLPKSLTGFWARREAEDIQAAKVRITVNECLAGLFRDAYSIPAPHVIYNTSHYVNHQDKRGESRNLLLQRYGRASGSECILLYIGWLHSGRGLEELIQAVSILPDKYLLTIMGDGPERENIQAQVGKLQLQNRISFWGIASREEIPVLAVGADIGLITQHPTGLNEINCSPNRLSDYLMAGLPLAMSDLPFLRRFDEKYRCAEFFDPRDANSISEAIQQIFEDQEKYTFLKQNTLKAAREFNWDTESQKFIKLYDELV